MASILDRIFSGVSFPKVSCVLLLMVLSVSCRNHGVSNEEYAHIGKWLVWADSEETIKCGSIQPSDMPRQESPHRWTEPLSPSWLKAMPNGSGQVLLLLQNGNFYRIEYKDGLKHGEKLSRKYFFDENDELVFTSTNYKQGLEDGKWIYWYSNWQRSMEGEYSKRNPAGQWTSWYPNGQKSDESFFHEGNRHGKRTSWYKNGVKQIESKYSNDELISRIEWNEDGKIKENLGPSLKNQD